MPVPTAAEMTVPPAVLVVLIALGVIELALIVVCLVDLARRPAVLGGRKWVWVAVILVFNLLGPIVYLAVGRATPPAADHPSSADDGTRDRASAAADLLYGPAAHRRDADGDQSSPPPPPA